METIKRIAGWIRSPKSDFSLFVILVILANVVSSGAFLRFDLTTQKSYSLSEASQRVIRTIEEPLSIKVFFTRNLPAPYNSVDRYLRDLLTEYRGVGNRQFSYEFFDMEKPENKDLAQSYGIGTIQVQEIKNDEVGLKNAYMGLAVVYGDGIEALNDLTSSDGLEYRLTTTIGKMIAKVDTLSGLAGKVSMTLYASSALNDFQIAGFSKLEKTVSQVFGKVNDENFGKMEYRFQDPASPAEIDALVQKYGLQKINWSKRGDKTEPGAGILGIVLEYRDNFRTIPLQIVRGLLGGYGIDGLQDLEDRLNASLQSLMSNSLSIGYVSGHGEKSLDDAQRGAAPFSQIASDLYQFRNLDLSKEDIPEDITAIVINGPRQKYSETELYKLDQFLMRGGNLLVFADPYNEVVPQGQNGFGGQPVYLPVTTGLEDMLAKYGIELQKNYVMDEASYIARQQGMGEVPIYYAPLIGKDGMNQKNSVSRHLANVIFIKAGEIKLSMPEGKEGKKAERTAVPLVTSSEKSWVMSGQISLDPYSIRKPAETDMSKHDLAVLVEGRFESAFEKTPASEETENGSASDLVSDSHLSRSVSPGKVLVVGTSELTTATLLDPEGRQPVAIFVRNALDYMTGNEELNDMRTKGLGFNPLDKSTPALRSAVKGVNMYGLPILVALIGLFAWRYRVRRKEKIRLKYAQPEYSRVGGKNA